MGYHGRCPKYGSKVKVEPTGLGFMIGTCSNCGSRIQVTETWIE